MNNFYLGIDIETTGTDAENMDHLILEFGFALCFLHRPEVYGGTMLINHRHLTGDDVALKMAKDNGILDRINKSETTNMTSDVVPWLAEEVEKATGVNILATEQRMSLLGKNLFAFDVPFLSKRCPGWRGLHKKRTFDHRSIDPAMFYTLPSDKFPPGLMTCAKRAGINPEVAHTAYADVLLTLELVHHHFGVSNSGKEVSAEEFKSIVRD